MFWLICFAVVIGVNIIAERKNAPSSVQPDNLPTHEQAS